MLKNILKGIRQLLEAYRDLQEEKRHHEEWAQYLHASGAVRDRESAESHKTQVVVTDDEVIVNYMDGRMVGQRHVTPNVIRPFGMKRR